MGVFFGKGPQESMEQLQEHKKYWAQHCPALLNTLSVKGSATIEKISGPAPEKTKEHFDAHSSYISHKVIPKCITSRSVSPL